MKIVKVTYTAKPNYVEQNKVNIQKVMADLRELNAEGVNYNSCLGADGQSFTHTAFFKSAEDEQILLTLPAFKHFQEQLKANGLETPPRQELLSIVGSSKNMF